MVLNIIYIFLTHYTHLELLDFYFIILIYLRLANKECGLIFNIYYTSFAFTEIFNDCWCKSELHGQVLCVAYLYFIPVVENKINTEFVSAVNNIYIRCHGALRKGFKGINNIAVITFTRKLKRFSNYCGWNSGYVYLCKTWMTDRHQIGIFYNFKNFKSAWKYEVFAVKLKIILRIIFCNIKVNWRRRGVPYLYRFNIWKFFCYSFFNIFFTEWIRILSDGYAWRLNDSPIVVYCKSRNRNMFYPEKYCEDNRPDENTEYAQKGNVECCFMPGDRSMDFFCTFSNVLWWQHFKLTLFLLWRIWVSWAVL